MNLGRIFGKLLIPLTALFWAGAGYLTGFNQRSAELEDLRGQVQRFQAIQAAAKPELTVDYLRCTVKSSSSRVEARVINRSGKPLLGVELMVDFINAAGKVVDFQLSTGKKLTLFTNQVELVDFTVPSPAYASCRLRARDALGKDVAIKMK